MFFFLSTLFPFSWFLILLFYFFVSLLAILGKTVVVLGWFLRYNWHISEAVKWCILSPCNDCSLIMTCSSLSALSHFLVLMILHSTYIKRPFDSLSRIFSPGGIRRTRRKQHRWWNLSIDHRKAAAHITRLCRRLWYQLEVFLDVAGWQPFFF